MSYQVTARKWRSQSFDELVGQNHVTTTLQNALINDRLPHALLLTGPRGTGKTSSARILAKALRCPNAVNFKPCNQCTECLEISGSRSPNVMEIDGASNNGVDAIRELRETVAYAPSSGKYKIYIIDEVHMLSTSAFNALLKTLEEPPDHVIFVLATTEVHKIPQTILSRCQRFDFRRIPTRLIADRLKLICDSDKIQTEAEALWMIARQGDGSMRDAQSLLDQVVTFANGPLTSNRVIEILGLTDRSLLFETLAALVARSTPTILQCLEKIALAGYESSLFINDLLENIRHLLLIKISGTESEDSAGESTPVLVELPDSEIRYLRDLGRASSEEDLHMLFDMALKTATELPRASEPRLVLEMSLLRIASAPRVLDLKKLLSGQDLPAAMAAAVHHQAPPARQGSAAPSSAQYLASAIVPPGVAPALAPAPKPSLSSLNLPPQEKWYELVQLVKSRDPLLGAKVEHLLFITEKNKIIELAVPAKMSFIKDQIADKGTRAKLQPFIDQHWGNGCSFNVSVAQDTAGGTSALHVDNEKEQKKKQSIEEQVAAHPMVRAANSAFKGQIKSIKENT